MYKAISIPLTLSNPKMPGNRKMTKKAPTRKRAKAVSKRLGRSSLNNRIHSFSRNFPQFTVTGSVAYAPYQSYTNVTLNQVVNSSEFSSLFDQYRISYCVTKFWLRIDPSAQTAASATYPKLYWVRDYNSQTILSQNDMRERSNLRIAVLKPDRPVVMKFIPNLLTQQNYTGLGTSSYTPVFKKFIDTGSMSAVHYGCIYNIDDLTNTNYKVDIETTVWFQCKNVK